MRYLAILIATVLLFIPGCGNKNLTSEKSLPALRKLLSPDLTKEQLIAKWGEPDARGSGRDLLYYDLPDGDRVTILYTNGRLFGAQHKGGTIVEYPRAE